MIWGIREKEKDENRVAVHADEPGWMDGVGDADIVVYIDAGRGKYHWEE